MKKRILVVEDEVHIREVVEYALGREGWEVTSYADGKRALDDALTSGYHAIVLDVMVPELDGLSFCRQLRSSKTRAARTPVLFLSARSEEVDRIVGLELGGDDYLTKPFSPRELVARVRALLRRSELTEEAPAPPTATRSLLHGPIELSLAAREVRCGGRAVLLTKAEFDLLAALLERPGVVLSRTQLKLRMQLADEDGEGERGVDTHVKRIRAKFRPSGLDPIATVHGIGYRASAAEELC